MALGMVEDNPRAAAMLPVLCNKPVIFISMVVLTFADDSMQIERSSNSTQPRTA
jgi:hypothetical protein